MKTYLKLKIEYLVGEARINKKYVTKALEKAARARAKVQARGEKYREGFLAQSMYRHRLDIIRPELRASHLAYNFLRGRKYSDVESRVKQSPDWTKVLSIAKDFNTTQDGNRSPYYFREEELEQKFYEWIKDPDVVHVPNVSKKRSERAPYKTREQWEKQKQDAFITPTHDNRYL